MANRRVETPATHQAAQRSNQKRKLPTQTPIQSNDQENCAAAANTQSNQQSKRQRRRLQIPGKAPRPEDVIVIDSSSEEEEDTKLAAKATPTPAASSASTRPPRAPVTAAIMEQLESEDYFIVLGLSRDATDADVKKAYRKLAIQWHPDKNRDHPRAEEFFKKIGEAYAVLSDPEKRKLYERRGKNGLTGASEASGSQDDASRGSPDDFGGFYRHRNFSSRRARDIFEAFFASMGMDPFAELFSPHERRPSRNGPRQTSGYASDAYENVHGDPGFGPGFGAGFGAMPMMMGFGGSRRGVGGFPGFGGNGLLDSFFSDEFPGFSGSSGFVGASGSGGGSGFSSQSVSTSSFSDRSGNTVTKKTTTTVNADGRSETVTEEYRNGRLVDSTSTQAASRLAGAGRMHLDAGGGGQPASSSRDGQRRLQSGGRARSNRAL